MVRNPLASPDIIGISAGASASAVIAILVLGLGGFAVSAFAFGGALLTALAIYLLAWRQGVSGYRLVLVGIGIGAMMYARDRLPDDPGEHLGRPGRAALADRQPQRRRPRPSCSRCSW